MGHLAARLVAQIRKYLIGILAPAATVAVVFFGPLERLELLWFDQLFELRGIQKLAAPIVIVMIDESSFQELNLQWPFPRALHGRLLDRISADRPLVIGLDVIFDSDSRFGPADDKALGAAIARAGNVALGLGIAQDEQVVVDDRGRSLGPQREVVNMPLPVIREKAAAIGPFNVPPDADGHVWRVPIRVRVPDPQTRYEWWLAFGAQLHRQLSAAGFPTKPLPDVAEILINFRGRLTDFERVPYYRVVNGEIPAGEFRDKIVLIGPTSEILHDVFATALDAGSAPFLADYVARGRSRDQIDEAKAAASRR